MAASMEHTRLTFSEAKSLISKCSFSHLEAVSSKRHVVLPPKFFNSILQGVREHLNSELQLVASWTDGVLMAYNNVKILETVGRIFDESPYIHFNVNADFIIFRPEVGCLLKGIVNKKSTYHVGCLVHQCFNASIHKPRDLESEWEGTQLQIGEEFIFKVTNIYTNNGVLSLRGNIHIEKTLKKKKKSKKKSIETADSSLKDNEDDLGKGDGFVSDSNTSNGDSGIGDISLIKPQKRKKTTNKEANNNLDINNDSETPNHKKKKKHKNEEDSNENGLDITDEDSTSQKKKKKKHKHDNNDHENEFLSKSMNDGSFKQKKIKQEKLNQSESDLQHIPETNLVTDYQTGKKKKIKQERIDETLSAEKISKKKRRHSDIDESQDFTVSSKKKIKKERM